MSLLHHYYDYVAYYGTIFSYSKRRLFEVSDYYYWFNIQSDCKKKKGQVALW